MVKIELGDQLLTTELTAESDIAANEAVAITSDGSVSPADNTMIPNSIGVSVEGVTTGSAVEVGIIGKVQCTASSQVTSGDPVVPGATAGQVAPLSAVDLSHSHTAFSTDGTDATVGADQSVVAGDGGTTSLLTGVSTSAQAAEDVLTDSVSQSVETTQAIGVVVTGAAAGNNAELLIGVKS